MWTWRATICKATSSCVRSRPKTHSKTESCSSYQLRLEGKCSWHREAALEIPALHREPKEWPKVNSPYTECKITTNVLLRWSLMLHSMRPGGGPDESASRVRVGYPLTLCPSHALLHLLRLHCVIVYRKQNFQTLSLRTKCHCHGKPQ